jgi:luciferase-type oxidoreductase
MVYAGWLAAATNRIAIGTAGIVSPLRDPLIVAKQAASIDRLSGGRFILGLATGDRPSEFAAFGSDIGNRVERYRDAVGVIRAAGRSFPEHVSQHYGVLDGTLDMLPKPVATTLPIVAIGRAGQDFDWLGEHTDGWIWHLSHPNRLADVIADWRSGAGDAFRPYGYGTMFDLLADPDAPLEVANFGMRGGRNALIDHWLRQRDEGVNHVALNMKPLRRPYADAVNELAEYVLPVFAGL